MNQRDEAQYEKSSSFTRPKSDRVSQMFVVTLTAENLNAFKSKADSQRDGLQTSHKTISVSLN